MPRAEPAHPATLLVAALLVAGLGLAPVLGSLDSAALGDRTVDGLGSWWMQWWVAEALAQGLSPMESPYFFHPWGKDILLDTGGNLVDAFVALPLRWLAGPMVAWNLLASVILASNALVAGLALRSLGTWPAVLGSLVAGLHPYVLFELESGRPTQALLAPAMAALFLGARAVGPGTGNWRHAVAAGACLGLAGWTYWYAAGFVALALCVLSLGRDLPRRVGLLLLTGAVSFACTAPAVVPLLGALDSGDVAPAIDTSQWWRALFDGGPITLETSVGDLGSLCTVDGLGQAWMWSSSHSQLQGLALTSVVGLLGFAAALRNPRWLVVGLLALVVAVGPEPFGHKNAVYITIAAWLPGFERLYWPCRALSLFVPLGALGVAALTRRLTLRVGPLAGLPLAGILFVSMGLGEQVQRGVWPLSTWDPSSPAAYACLAEAEGAAVVLPYGRDHEHLVHQTVHRRPMLGGMSERSDALVPAAQQELRRDNGWLAGLLRSAANPRARIEWTEAEREAVGALGYRWVIVRMPDLSFGTQGNQGPIQQRIFGRRMAELAGAPVYQDSEVAIHAPWGHHLSCEPEAEPVDAPPSGR